MSSPNDYRTRARELFWADHSRDQWTCPDCARGQDEILGKFEVHHIDGDYTNQRLSNLVALCQPCHNLREGKKPSIRKTRHIRDQLDERGVSVGANVPVCRSRSQYDTHINEFDNQQRPALVINQIESTDWAEVECDMGTANGALVRRPEEGDNERLKVSLAADGAESVNQMLAKYDSVETRDYKNISALGVSASGSNFLSFPPMRPPVAHDLARDIQAIVMNPYNWRPRQRWADGPIYVADVEWLADRYCGQQLNW